MLLTSRSEKSEPCAAAASRVDPFGTLFVETIETLVDLVDDPTEVGSETRDPNDDYLVALARAHDVEFIVSGDKDLLEWETQQPPVVTPSQLEQRLRT